jgi:hypothetical protein
MTETDVRINDVEKLKTPAVKELLGKVQHLSYNDQIDLMLETLIKKKRCEMSEEDIKNLDETLDEVFNEQIGKKGEILTDEMIKTLQNRACQRKSNPKRQEGGFSSQLLMVGLVFAVTAINSAQGNVLNLGQEKNAQQHREGNIKGKKVGQFNPKQVANVNALSGTVSILDRVDNIDRQLAELSDRANAPASVLEYMYNGLTVENAQVMGNFAIVGGAILLAQNGVPVPEDMIAAIGALGVFNKVIAEGKVLDVGVDGIKKLGKNIENGINDLSPPNKDDVAEYHEKVVPIIEAIEKISDEFKNLGNYKHINGLDKLEFHLNNMKIPPTEINNLKRLITLSYLYKSVGAYKRFMDIALPQLKGNMDHVPSNVDLPTNAIENIHQLQIKLDGLLDKLPGKDIRVELDDVYKDVGPILKLLDTKSSSEITEENFATITKYLHDEQYTKVQNYLTPSFQTQVYNLLYGQERGQQNIFDSLYNEMEKIGKEANANAYGTRNQWTEYSMTAILGLSVSFFGITCLGVYSYFSRPSEKKTGGKKTKNKRKRHNNKSKKIRPRKTTNKRVKKHKSKRKHK